MNAHLDNNALLAHTHIIKKFVGEAELVVQVQSELACRVQLGQVL